MPTRPAGMDALLAAARTHLGITDGEIHGFLFVDRRWFLSRTPASYFHVPTENYAEEIAYVKETWRKDDRPDSIGSMYAPSEARPYCVVARLV